eukprot:scaffold45545_cov22-Tisochrysis_lutea.AAC.1
MHTAAGTGYMHTVADTGYIHTVTDTGSICIQQPNASSAGASGQGRQQEMHGCRRRASCTCCATVCIDESMKEAGCGAKSDVFPGRESVRLGCKRRPLHQLGKTSRVREGGTASCLNPAGPLRKKGGEGIPPDLLHAPFLRSSPFSPPQHMEKTAPCSKHARTHASIHSRHRHDVAQLRLCTLPFQLRQGAHSLP